MMPDETGYKLELSEATEGLAEALAAGDAQALRKAAGDHATALNSQATAMAASIAAPLYTRLGEIAASVNHLAVIVTNARQADLGWRTEERLTRDAQSTRLYDELDRLIAASEESGRRLGKLELHVAALTARGKTADQRLDRKRVEIDELKREVAELRAWRDAQERSDHASH